MRPVATNVSIGDHESYQEKKEARLFDGIHFKVDFNGEITISRDEYNSLYFMKGILCKNQINIYNKLLSNLIVLSFCYILVLW